MVKTEDTTNSEQALEEAIAYAKKYVEDLISFFGLNTDVYATRGDEDIIELHVPSSHLNGFLIGQRGDTLRALQFMVASALRNNEHEYNRVHIDVADYKKQRAERLGSTAESWVKKVKETGEEMHLKPMSAADRRTIHKLANEEGLVTESVGEGHERHVVLKLDDTKDKTETPEASKED